MRRWENYETIIMLQGILYDDESSLLITSSRFSNYHPIYKWETPLLDFNINDFSWNTWVVSLRQASPVALQRATCSTLIALSYNTTPLVVSHPHCNLHSLNNLRAYVSQAETRVSSACVFLYFCVNSTNLHYNLTPHTCIFRYDKLWIIICYRNVLSLVLQPG